MWCNCFSDCSWGWVLILWWEVDWKTHSSGVSGALWDAVTTNLRAPLVSENDSLGDGTKQKKQEERIRWGPVGRMLAIWSLVPLPILNPAFTSESSQFTYCWSLAWRILSITLMWNECHCMVVWTFFGIALLWDWNENWPFPAQWLEDAYKGAWYARKGDRNVICYLSFPLWIRVPS